MSDERINNCSFNNKLKLSVRIITMIYSILKRVFLEES